MVKLIQNLIDITHINLEGFVLSDHIRFDLTKLLHSLQGSSVPPRRSHNQESNPYFDSDLTSRDEQTQTLFSDRYHRHLRQPYPNGLDEVE